MTQKNTYLDNLSTTPLDPRVLDSMLPYMTTFFGNPSSRTHTFGFKAEDAIIKAKKQVAKLINCNYDELIIVSGATEANNLAIKGLAEFKKIEIENDFGKEFLSETNIKSKNLINTKIIGNENNEYATNVNTIDNRPHIITSQTEHKSVLDTLRNLKDFRVTYLPVDKKGHINSQDLENSITKNTILVSIMSMNNEIGTVQDLKKIGDICKSKNVVFHVDAAQSVGKIPLDVKDLNINMLSLSGHKMYGPKGIGMLYLSKRPRIRIKQQNFGGGQERNLRSGTLPTHLVVGLGKAAEICQQELVRDFERIKKMSELLYGKLKKKLGDIVLNGGYKDSGITNGSVNATNEEENDKNMSNENLSSIEMQDENNSNFDKNTTIVDENNATRKSNEDNMKNNIADTNNNVVASKMKSLSWFPGCLNISFPYVEGEGLLMKLKNFALSSGSACTSASLEPSYVLRALGQDEDLAHSSIRFGIGRFTTTKEIREVAKKTINAVLKLREMSPLYEMVNEGVDLKSIKWSGE